MRNVLEEGGCEVTVREIVMEYFEDHSCDSVFCDIVKEFLEEEECDGLCCEDCGCEKDSLFPCGESCADCKPAKKRTCSDCAENCPYDGPHPGGWCMESKEICYALMAVKA